LKKTVELRELINIEGPFHMPNYASVLKVAIVALGAYAAVAFIQSKVSIPGVGMYLPHA
jgi:hypothetical protein